MARIKHIALVTDDPAKTAEFYKQHFGLTELYRRPSKTGENGVWLSDGYIYFAILKFGTGDAPKLGPGQTSDLRGIHHTQDAVQPNAVAEAGIVEGHGNTGRLGHAAGFEQEVLRPFRPVDRLHHRLDEVVADGAADAAVG